LQTVELLFNAEFRIVITFPVLNQTDFQLQLTGSAFTSLVKEHMKRTKKQVSQEQTIGSARGCWYFSYFAAYKNIPSVLKLEVP